MNAPGTRVVGYLRVSTHEQTDSGAGIAAQRHTIEQHAERRGWQIVTMVEDSGSAKSTRGRPALAAALTLVRGGAADALVVSKLDRLSRSIIDFATLMDEARRERWALIVLDCDFDMTTPAGEMMANMLACFAQFERRVIGQRTKDALAQKRAEGVVLGRPRKIPDAVVARIEREKAAGATLTAIAARLNEDAIPTAQGGAQWHPSTVRKVLHRVG